MIIEDRIHREVKYQIESRLQIQRKLYIIITYLYQIFHQKQNLSSEKKLSAPTKSNQIISGLKMHFTLIFKLVWTVKGITIKPASHFFPSVALWMNFSTEFSVYFFFYFYMFSGCGPGKYMNGRECSDCGDGKFQNKPFHTDTTCKDCSGTKKVVSRQTLDVS